MIEPKRLEKIKKKLSVYPIFTFLGKGRRGAVYKISPRLVVKIQRDDIYTFNVIKNEFDILKKIGHYKYFPKPVYYDEKLKYLIREFVDGELIENMINKKTITESLKMCYVLDKEGVNQQELNNPFKHIFVSKNKIMMIDFEKARLTTNPKNVNQFSQYLIKKLRIKINKEFIDLLKEYKKDYNKKTFKKIISFFQI